MWQLHSTPGSLPASGLVGKESDMIFMLTLKTAFLSRGMTRLPLKTITQLKLINPWHKVTNKKKRIFLNSVNFF